MLYIYATSPFNSLQLWPGIPVVYLWYHWSLFIHILTCNISGKSRQVPIPTFCLQQILNGISQKYQAAGQELVQNILLRFCTTRPGVGTSDLHPEAGQWGPELSKIKSSCLAHLWMSIEINLGSSDWLILLVTVPQSVTVGNNTLLALILASSTCLKEFKLHTVYSGILQHRKKLQLDSWTCWSSCREDNQRFWLQNQIKGQAHGAALQHSLGWSDGQSQTCVRVSATNAHKIPIH